MSCTNDTALSLLSSTDELSGAIPIIIPNSSTVATNGNITVTALPTTYAGAWVYLPADAVVDGEAGFYWTTFSSTTAGSVKTNYIDPTEEFIPYVPTGTITTAVGSNSAYVTPTDADITMVNISLPANSLSSGTTVKMFSRVTCPSATDAKTVSHKLGSTAIGTQAFTTSTGGTLTTGMFVRAADKQVLGSFGDSAIAATTFGTVDLTDASSLVITGKLAATTGYFVLEAFNITKAIG